jgi:hypothetical protein
VTFTRWVPHLWEAKLEAPAGYIFPTRTIGEDIKAFDYFKNTSQAVLTEAKTKNMLTRLRSQQMVGGFGSFTYEHIGPSAMETDVKRIGGTQVDTFTGIQAIPRDKTEQPKAVDKDEGGATPLSVTNRASLLTKTVSLQKAIDDAASDDRKELKPYLDDTTFSILGKRKLESPKNFSKTLLEHARRDDFVQPQPKSKRKGNKDKRLSAGLKRAQALKLKQLIEDTKMKVD